MNVFIYLLRLMMSESIVTTSLGIGWQIKINIDSITSVQTQTIELFSLIKQIHGTKNREQLILENIKIEVKNVF